MSTFADALLLSAVLFGHTALWVALFNRVHALPLPCRVINALEKLHALCFLAGPSFCLWWFARGRQPGDSISGWLLENAWLTAYAGVCLAVGAIVAVAWCRRQLSADFFRRRSGRRGLPAATLLSNHTTKLDVAKALGRRPSGSLSTRLLDAIPGNQLFELHVQHKSLQLASLAEELDGLSIAHLSDLHFTGKICRDYFDFVIDRTNELDADMVAITGDIIDKSTCLDWIAPTLGRLRSRHGVYFVLGNHDKRLRDVAGLRRTLVDAGLIDLGGRTLMVRVRNRPLLLAGNEAPWFGPRPAVPPPQQDDEPLTPFRLLLAHTPDQIGWARRHGFHLMLAGHTHGGQIRLPGIGPVFTPSLYGTKYACGIFFESPTLMHVTRGISALDPIRIRCAPELAMLILHRAGTTRGPTTDCPAARRSRRAVNA